MFVANLIDSSKKSKGSGKMFGFLSKSSELESSDPIHQIIIEKNLIRIITPEGYISREFDIIETSTVLMKDVLDVSFGNIQKQYSNLKGSASTNSIQFEHQGSKEKLEFEIDSYTSIGELKKQILYWKSKGIKVLDEKMYLEID